MTESIRVLIADDHAPFRTGLRTLLQATPDTTVVGEAATGQEAVTLAASLQPDLILMDLHMPGVNGIAVTRQILHTSPHIAILVVTMFEGDDSVFAALRAGARGYTARGRAQGRTAAGNPRCQQRGGHLRASNRQAVDAVLRGTQARRGAVAGVPRTDGA